MAWVTYKISPRNISLDRDDLIRLVDFVSQRGDELKEKERALFTWEGLSEADTEKLQTDLENAFKPAVFIYGQEGEELLVHNSDIFKAPECPEVVNRVIIDTFIPYRYRANGKDPRSGCRIDIDFSSAKILDWQNNISGPTPNTSEVGIQGSDDAYTTGVLRYLQRLFGARKNYRNFLHGAFTYDLYLWLICMPTYFYAVTKYDSYIDQFLVRVPTPIRIAIYVYSFFLAANLYRVLIGYIRWTFQSVEFTGTRSTQMRHRRFWAFLGSAIVIPIVLHLILPK